MLKNRKVAIVIPAHDEEKHVCGVVEAIPAFVDLIIVVDDGSRDATAERVRRLLHPRLVLLQHTKNRGVGAAIVTGYRFALENRADVVGVMGGDGQMEAHYLPSLLEPVIEGHSDFAKGNRFFSWRSWRDMPLIRVVGNVILSLLTKPAAGYWHVFDAQNGYTAISSSMLRRLPLDRLETGYQFENILLLNLSLAGAVVTDVPIPAVYGEEQSGIKASRDVPVILWALLTGFMTRVRQSYLRPRMTSPGALLLCGVLLILGGLVAGIWSSLAGVRWLSIASTIGVILGVVFFGMFFFADVLVSRRFRAPQARPPRRHGVAVNR